MLTHEQEEKLERLVELHLGHEFELGIVHEVGSVREVNDILIEDCGEEGKKYPDFDDPVSEEDEAKLRGLSVEGLRLRKKQNPEAYGLSPTGRLPGVMTGRLASSDALSNLPKSPLKGHTLISADFSDLEMRVLKQHGLQPKEPSPKNVVKTPTGKEVEITWHQCSEGCAGWLHMNEPYEIEECDDCERFQLVDDVHELAVKAHREECGCGWPEFDRQDAAMAWLDTVSEGGLDGLTEADFKELEGLLNVRGTLFMDNVTPAIYVCSRLIEKTKEGPNNINLRGLMKLLKETQEKIHNEELKLKDFGSPPEAEEVHEG